MSAYGGLWRVKSESEPILQLLGLFELRINGTRVQLGEPKQQSLLALFALHRAAFVSITEIVEALWDGLPPARVRNQIQVYVSRLRRVLTPVATWAIHTEPDGYLLEVPADRVDLAVFDNAVRRGTTLARSGNWPAADRELHTAMACWRGRALGGVRGDFFARHAAHLEERRIAAFEQHLGVKLALGQYAEAVNSLRPIVATYPLHEGLRHGFMIALYRAGRPAEALAAYREGRSQIIDQLGIEPGPELRSLERRILRGDPIPNAHY
ncbi:hypothetical protein Ari01nite_46710 [Paractinoplanes rishiriensis]|uniref:OmpR/PhoB-type domain-containing protein n=1 Tax=Paractinoplanes rishiriensis TaxID=1050105 RepID=A0A919MRH3_9ACTN|nr:hypothetical protein Ari01nite_46710 [Actinoplanes rishiriensis]